jgi:hypothetical protein
VPPDDSRPAYYAAGSGGWRDWWTLLHPPYTGWHLSYAVIGASLAPRVQTSRLIATVLAFFLAVGLAAHALDELRDRPLRTRIPSWALVLVVVVGLLGALALGVLGVIRVGWVLVPFLVAGPALVIGYNAELFGGAMHTDLGFAAAWGAFPVLTAYVAQAGTLAIAPVLAALGALALSAAQRRLSTPARNIRRRATAVDGTITFADGRVVSLTADVLIRPLERALRASSWAIMLLAAAFAVARLGLLSSGWGYASCRRRAPGPSRLSVSSGLASRQVTSDRQPQPMQPVSRSRRSSSSRIRSSRSWRHAAESRAQSAGVGVRPAGRVSSAALIRASGMPSRCDARMKASRRSVTRGYRRWFPAVRPDVIRPLAS